MSETEECSLASTGDDAALEAELLRGYASWLEGRLYDLRDWIRCGDGARLSVEARAIAVNTSGLWGERVSRLAMQLQVAATRGEALRQARLCGRLGGRIDALRQAADVIEGCRIASKRAA